MRFKRIQARFWVYPFFGGTRNHTGKRAVLNRD